MRESAVESLADEKPGPGAYELKGQFMTDLRKNPAKGVSSAFKSKTKRMFSHEGTLIDASAYPGTVLSDAPGVGTYTPKDTNSIAAAAAALKRRAEKLANRRKGKQAENKSERMHVGAKSTADIPGPGAYDVDRLTKQKEARPYSAKHSSFKSGSRRALPWGGRGVDAPQSIRARTIDDLEVADLEGPGPGEYAVPSSFQAPKPSARRAKGGVWTKGAARFATGPTDDNIGPSAVHYFPNYSQCS